MICMALDNRDLHSILSAIVFKSIDCEGVDADMNIDAAIEIAGDIMAKVDDIHRESREA